MLSNQTFCLAHSCWRCKGCFRMPTNQLSVNRISTNLHSVFIRSTLSSQNMQISLQQPSSQSFSVLKKCPVLQRHSQCLRTRLFRVKISSHYEPHDATTRRRSTLTLQHMVSQGCPIKVQPMWSGRFCTEEMPEILDYSQYIVVFFYILLYIWQSIRN